MERGEQEPARDADRLRDVRLLDRTFAAVRVLSDRVLDPEDDDQARSRLEKFLPPIGAERREGREPVVGGALLVGRAACSSGENRSRDRGMGR